MFFFRAKVMKIKVGHELENTGSTRLVAAYATPVTTPSPRARKYFKWWRGKM